MNKDYVNEKLSITNSFLWRTIFLPFSLLDAYTSQEQIISLSTF